MNTIIIIIDPNSIREHIEFQLYIINVKQNKLELLKILHAFDKINVYKLAISMN